MRDEKGKSEYERRPIPILQIFDGSGDSPGSGDVQYLSYSMRE